MTTEEILDQITELSKEWYILIGRDHHKDRDCHFYINTVWSYGQKQKYRVEHFGYIFDDIEEEFDTYRQAAEFLLNKIREMIEIERNQEELPKKEFIEKDDEYFLTID
jgi:hypothetical protein